MTEEKKEERDEVLIDFSALGATVKKWKHKLLKKNAGHPVETHHQETHQKEHTQEKQRSEEKTREDALDIKETLSETVSWLKSNGKWILPLLCIFIAVFASVYLRTMPLRMPLTDGWAENTVNNFYQNQLQQQMNQQYPNLPEQNRNALFAKEWEKFQLENQQQLDQQTKQLSEQYKSQFRDDKGTTYLLGIDPYHYYRQTRLVLENGFPGTEIKDGKLWDSYRMAPVGDLAEWNFHHWFGAYWHRFLNLFGDYPLMFTFFLVGTLFSALTVIPAFFIGRMITKNTVGGFFTAMLMAVSSFFVARTTGESSDTDVYAVFFPVLITWLFLEAMEKEKLKQKLLWISLAGFATGVFAFAWTGWWYTSTFIIITLVAYGLFQIIANIKQSKQVITSASFLENIYLLLGYALSSTFFLSIFGSFGEIVRVLRGPFQFLKLKAVAVSSYWPNIRTTVAELNVPSFAKVIEQFDGKLFFILAIVGILLTLAVVKKGKNEETEIEKKWSWRTLDFRISFFLAMWFAAASFATTKGIRFILQLTPVFAFGLGAFLGITWLFASRWITKELKVPSLVSKILLILVLSLLLISPAKSGYSQAYNSAPSMSDGWYNALTKIKMEAPQKSIITSWWDFGHWFKALAERPVTFDGGNQVGYGAHWVGKALLTNNEHTTAGIVRMLNCGQNSAFTELDAIFHDALREIDIINKIIIEDKSTAIKTLSTQGLSAEQIARVTQYTHCDAPTDYFITSEDMVGKSGVWGHFGSWDFKRAVMYLETKKLSRSDAVEYLTKKFNLSPEEADKTHSEIQSTDADKWISPWPSFLSGSDTCIRLSDEELRCVSGVQGSSFALRVNTKTWNLSFENNPEVVPNSLVYADREGIHEKEFEGKKTGFSVMLIPQKNQDIYALRIADPLQAGGTFSKLFFFEGHGMKCFQKFDDTSASGTGRIITWIVDYGCQQENKVFFLPKEEVHASHILVSLEGRTEEEALAIVKEIQNGLTQANFGTRAKEYSDDPGSKESGGDLGWFGKGTMVPEFEQAAFSLNKGEISSPIKTQFGYHLIFLQEKRTS